MDNKEFIEELEKRMTEGEIKVDFGFEVATRRVKIFIHNKKNVYDKDEKGVAIVFKSPLIDFEKMVKEHEDWKNRQEKEDYDKLAKTLNEKK